VPEETPWPVKVMADKTTLLVYQPQLDAFDGYHLVARAAVEAKEADGKSSYGIIYVTALEVAV
jgi:hypothetical protein